MDARVVEDFCETIVPSGNELLINILMNSIVLIFLMNCYDYY